MSRLKPILLAFLLAFQISAQDAAPTKFEVVSIHPGTKRPYAVPPVTYDPGRLRLQGVPMIYLMTLAFELPHYRIVGPEWMDKAIYDIEGVPPAGTSARQLPSMLRAMLEERFGLRTRFEDRAVRGFDLVKAKNPPNPSQIAGSAVYKIRARELDPFDEPLEAGQWTASFQPGKGVIGGKAISYSALATALSRTIQADIDDSTGISETADRVLFFDPEFARALSAEQNEPNSENAPTPSGSAYPGLQAALREQLGLELKPKRVTRPVLVIDRLERESSGN